MTGGRRSATLLVVTAAALLGAGLLGAGPVLAEERVVRIGRSGVQPQVLRAAPGDTVRFVNDDPTFAYRAQSTGGPWRFDSGPTALLDGAFAVPSALPEPGTYTYRVAQDAPFQGTVVVGDGTAPAASPPTSAGEAPVTPSTASPAPEAVPAVPGPLAGPPSSRDLGLALAVAAVLLVGTVSLLLRLLLALPVLSGRAARR